MTALNGQVALVTGASRGIGAATAEALAAAGAHVVLTGRDTKALEAVEQRIFDAGGSATIAPVDLADADGIARLANAITERWQRLDILIHAATVLGFALAVASASAQFAPPPPSRPFPGFMNENLRGRDPYLSVWDIGANLRLRYESKQGAGFTDAGSNWDFSKRPVDDIDNSYLLYRLMPRVAYTGKRFAATVEGRSSYSFGDERYAMTAPGQGLAERDGGLDLHQAFVFLGNHKEFPVSVKLGRQELAYGDQRLVGHFRWNNNARTFDGIKVRYQTAPFGVDLFTGGVVYNDHRNLNIANFQDLFSSAYFNFPSVAKNELVERYR